MKPSLPAPLAALAGLVLLAGCATAPRPPTDTARRVLWLGDSITFSGGYIVGVEAALLARPAAARPGFINLGLPSETVSGLSEDGHAGGKFPRPDLRERLDRALAAIKPDLVFACYGMNDGIYLPFAEERFEKYRAGLARLRARVAATGARLILLTPPVYDPLPLGPKAAAGYAEALDRYAAWLLAQRAQGWEVIDLHGPMAAALAARRAAAPNFNFARDGVHADAAGHAVLARALLDAWGLPPAPERPELTVLVRERSELLRDAWLSAVGHSRPGMKPGVPVPEAEKRAAALTEKITALLAK